jgi:hypothetical protein
MYRNVLAIVIEPYEDPCDAMVRPPNNLGRHKHEQEAAASRPPRFYVPAPLPAVAGELIDLDAEESKHASKALRLAEGDAVELCDGVGGLLLGRIASIGKKGVGVEAAKAAQQVSSHTAESRMIAGSY